MKPIPNFIPCKKCGCAETPKFTRKRNRNNRIRYEVSSICILCRREDLAIYNRARYKSKSTEYLNRNKQWRDNNREAYNASQRKWYAKNKELLCEKARKRYVKKPAKPGFKGERKPLAKNHPWRGFDFRNHNNAVSTWRGTQ